MHLSPFGSSKLAMSKSSQFDNIAPARLLIALMKICGMWTFKEWTWNAYYRCYALLLHLCFTFLFIVALYINIGMATNIVELSEGLYMSLTETAMLVKVINILCNTRTAVDFFETFERNGDGLPHNAAEVAVILQAHTGFRRLRNLHISGSLATLTFAMIVSLLDASFRLPYPYWSPFDYHNKRNYFYAYSYDVACMLVTATSNVTMDLFQAYLLLQLAVYYKLLGMRLDAIGKDVANASQKSAELAQLHKHFELHSLVASLTQACEHLISYPVAIQILMSAFVLCFTTYKMTHMNFIEVPLAYLAYLIFALVMTLQIYLPCVYGDELTRNAHALTNAMYSANWIDLPLGTQKQIFIYMEYLKRPVAVRAAKFFDIGLGVFTQTMVNAYRLYALLLNIEI